MMLSWNSVKTVARIGLASSKHSEGSTPSSSSNYKGKLPKLSWGKLVTGILILECKECGTIWKLEVEDFVIAEGIGERCLECEKVTTNWVIDLLPLENIERWLG